MRLSFTKAERILKRRDYLALSKSGRRVQTEHFIAYFASNPYSGIRIGITVTKKVGSAVKRNRIKRIVREYFRLNRHCLSGKWDINIIAKRHIADLSSEKAYRSLQDLFERISSYDDHQQDY